jgi:predicted O-methyltransferase YrrM
MRIAGIAVTLALLSLAACAPPAESVDSQDASEQEALDQRVRDFLAQKRWRSRTLNVSQADGQKLHDLIVENGYTRAVEVGTSTGHSTIWIAWALSKTGGKLITIEIHERRHQKALENLEAAGLSAFVDARLADAHELVPELEGSFDFAFIDADKDWYVRYFNWLLPKLDVGGCFTAHNVAPSGEGSPGKNAPPGKMEEGTAEFVQEILATPGLATDFFMADGGLSISYKR